MEFNRKHAIIALVIGGCFFAFIFLAQFSNKISNIYVSLIGIVLGTIVAYSACLALIKNKLYFYIGAVGYKLAFIGTGIVLIIVSIVKFISPKTDNWISSDKIIKQTIDNNKCFEVRYGKFYNGFDTIYRYKKKQIDYEQINTNIPQRIKWIDSCTYLRIINKEVVEEIVQLGNFDKKQHTMHSKPIVYNKNSNKRERIEYLQQVD